VVIDPSTTKIDFSVLVAGLTSLMQALYKTQMKIKTKVSFINCMVKNKSSMKQME